jgi:HAMP domain-containing protein
MLNRRWSIQVLVVLMAVAPVVLIGAAFMVVNAVVIDNTADRLGTVQIAAATDRVAESVKAHLETARRISDRYAAAVRTGRLEAGGPAALREWERAFLNDLLVNPGVSSLCMANMRGDTAWVLRSGPGLQVGRVDGRDIERALELPMAPDGTVGSEPMRPPYRYSALERPWFRLALENQQPTWTSVYFWYGERAADTQASIGFTRRIFSPAGELLGVLVVDLSLGALSDSLRQMPISNEGSVYILDEQGLLVAASEGGVNTPEGQRARLDQSRSDAARAVALVMAPGPIAEGASATLELRGEPVRFQVSRVKPAPGVDWRIVTTLNQGAYVRQAADARSRGLLFALMLTAAGAVLAIGLSRRIARPLGQIRDHVRRLGGGDFEARLHLDAAEELVELSEELNRVGAELGRTMDLQLSLRLARQMESLAQRRGELDRAVGDASRRLLDAGFSAAVQDALAIIGPRLDAEALWWWPGCTHAAARSPRVWWLGTGAEPPAAPMMIGFLFGPEDPTGARLMHVADLPDELREMLRARALAGVVAVPVRTANRTLGAVVAVFRGALTELDYDHAYTLERLAEVLRIAFEREDAGKGQAGAGASRGS